MSKKRRDIPVFDQPIIETHCHLDYLKDRPLAETLAEAQRVNIERVITIAVSPDNLATVRELSQTAPWVYGTQGVHPHDAEQYSDAAEAEIRAHAGDDKIVAVGEIGLDYFAHCHVLVVGSVAADSRLPGIGLLFGTLVRYLLRTLLSWAT